MKRFFTPFYLLVYAGGAIVLALVVSILLNREPAPSYESVTVSRGEVIQDVSVTGRVESGNRRDLGFTGSGIVASVYAKNGDMVSKGAVIARLSGAVSSAEAEAANAALSAELRRLDEIVAANRDEDVAISTAGNAQASARTARAVVASESTIASAALRADDALRTHIDPLYENGATDDPSFGVVIESGSTQYHISADPQRKVLLSQKRRTATDRLRLMQEDGLYINADTAAEALMKAEATLAYLELFAADIGAEVASLVGDNTSEQAVYDSFKADVSSARSAFATLRKEVRAAMDELSAARAAEAIAAAEEEKVSASARPEAVAVQEAVVAAARAKYAAAAARSDETVLRVPIAGVISGSSLKVGEPIAAGETALTVTAPGGLEIIIAITEADVDKIELGDRAQVTFDAKDDLLLKATVVSIAPSETIIDGVPTYETTLALDDMDASIKPGMTADVEIRTDERMNALYVPGRAIIRENGAAYLRIVTSEGDIEKRAVTVGLRGSDGRTEIVDGLFEGDEVVLFVENGAGL